MAVVEPFPSLPYPNPLARPPRSSDTSISLNRLLIQYLHDNPIKVHMDRPLGFTLLAVPLNCPSHLGDPPLAHQSHFNVDYWELTRCCPNIPERVQRKKTKQNEKKKEEENKKIPSKRSFALVASAIRSSATPGFPEFLCHSAVLHYLNAWVHHAGPNQPAVSPGLLSFLHVSLRWEVAE